MQLAAVAAIMGLLSFDVNNPSRLSEALDCALREARSTAGEDLLLAPLLLNAARRSGQQPATFIEIGAFNGINGSNTLIYERCFGFDGALIEASPPNFEALQESNRKGAMVHAAVCSGEGSIKVSTGKVSTVAGDMSKMGNTHLRRWASERKGTVSVPCKPLLTLYDDAMAARRAEKIQRQPEPQLSPQWNRNQPVTFLSLDVEGAELDVLQSVPHLDRQPFDVLLVENEYNNLRDKLVMALLLKSGYTKFLMPAPLHGGTNDLYVSQRQLSAAYTLLGNRTARWSGKFGVGMNAEQLVKSLRRGLKKLTEEGKSGIPAGRDELNAHGVDLVAR